MNNKENIKHDKELKRLSILFIFSIILIIFLIIFLMPNYTIEETDSQSTDENSTSEIESTSTDISEELSEEEIIILEPISKQYIIVESDSISELKAELKYCKENLSLAQYIIDSAIALGYESCCDFLQVVYQDCKNYQSYIDYYEERINELSNIKHTEGLGEYPIATYIWYYMKEQGWSDYVCAGIMGNIMQETGGRTLDIDYLHDSDYYGMCCWKKEYHPKVVGLGLVGQCEYLIETTAKAMDNYGYLYQEGYTFQDFLEAESVEEAAAAFMIVYERPEHTNPTKRVENGEKAYEYFVG